MNSCRFRCGRRAERCLGAATTSRFHARGMRALGSYPSMCCSIVSRYCAPSLQLHEALTSRLPEEGGEGESKKLGDRQCVYLVDFTEPSFPK